MLFAISGLILSAIPADNSDGAESSENGTYVKGLICEIGSSGPTPAADIPVTLTYDEESFEGKTDEEGYFNIKISDNLLIDTTKKVEFSFELSGYSVFALPDTMTSLEQLDSNGGANATPVAEIDLSKCTKKASTGKVTYTATDDAQHCILLGDTYVTVSFTVTDNATGTAIRNAEITLKNAGNTYFGKTNYDGVCTISSRVLIGTYELTIKCDGYVLYEGTVVITKSVSKLSVGMDQKEPTMYLGMTLYHLMMVIGVTVGLCLVVISYVLCTRTWKNVDKNDVKE